MYKSIITHAINIDMINVQIRIFSLKCMNVLIRMMWLIYSLVILHKSTLMMTYMFYNYVLLSLKKYVLNLEQSLLIAEYDNSQTSKR